MKFNPRILELAIVFLNMSYSLGGDAKVFQMDRQIREVGKFHLRILVPRSSFSFSGQDTILKSCTARKNTLFSLHFQGADLAPNPGPLRTI